MNAISSENFELINGLFGHQPFQHYFADPLRQEEMVSIPIESVDVPIAEIGRYHLRSRAIVEKKKKPVTSAKTVRIKISPAVSQYIIPSKRSYISNIREKIYQIVSEKQSLTCKEITQQIQKSLAKEPSKNLKTYKYLNNSIRNIITRMRNKNILKAVKTKGKGLTYKLR